ncbi:MAG: 23S rRNA (guanosine(2251)-2'-O)-methyltransferase RlmB [Chloroflexota bacterium]
MSELIYGRRAVMETLRAGRRHLYRLWLEGDEQDKQSAIIQSLLALANEKNLPLRFIKGGLFEKLERRGQNPQGVALEVDEYPYVELDECLDYAYQRKEDPLLLILDHLEDPQNLGTLIRSAEVLGAHGLIIPDRRAAKVTPAVSNASAGAVEHLRVALVTNLNRLIDELKRTQIWVAGLDSNLESPFPDRKTLAGPLAIVVGSEGKGLSRLTREKCDFLVRLPMLGQVESLNAAVAGSILLYAAREART